MNYHSNMAKLAQGVTYTDRGRSYTPTQQDKPPLIGTLVPSQKRCYKYQTYQNNQIENHKVEIIQQHFFPNRVNTVLTTTDQKDKRHTMSPLNASHTRMHVSPRTTRQTMSPINRRMPLNVSPVSHTLSNVSNLSKVAVPQQKDNEDYKSLYFKVLHDKSLLE